MGAPDLIQWFRRDGFVLTLLPSGGLAVQPASKLTDEHRRAIRQHRDALVLLLFPGETNPKEPDSEVTDPDRHAWPHTTAMNTTEIETFIARLDQFTRHGLGYTYAERLADGLVVRDRELDDRRLCLECRHLQAAGKTWACSQWRQAEMIGAVLPTGLVELLQRCNGFKQTTL